MTSLERPLPLPVVVVILSAISVGGFAFGLKGAMEKTDHQAASTAPLAEVSGVPVRDAQPVAVVAVAPPPPAEAPKPKPVTDVAQTPDDATPVVEAPPVPTEPEKKPEPPPQTTPQRIEDLY
jgi:outer membrane biosynthesis protein TonB